MSYIFDGEIHPLDEEYAYIIEKIQGNHKSYDPSKNSTIGFKKQIFYSKYAEYLYENDREKTISFLRGIFCGGDVPDTDLILRTPSESVDPLNQVGTIALKFKRSPNDKLK